MFTTPLRDLRGFCVTTEVRRVPMPRSPITGRFRTNEPTVADWRVMTNAVFIPGEKRIEMDPWTAHLERVLDQVSATMQERHAKYGPGNIAEHGMTGIKVRLGDKYARLKAGALDYEDESLRDTFLDLIGYSVIGIMWLDKTWPGSEDK